MDLFYGRARTLSKFKVLEIVARVPYQAWENVAYIALTHLHGKPAVARRVFEFVIESRAQQDNEQWHLLTLQELIAARGIREGFVRYRAIPQLLALFYYHVSWLLYVIAPSLSYALNADFEDHAEHEYMNYVAEHPELDEREAELFRQIGLDERHHKEESLAHVGHPRFSLA
jgi:demethoxyubiquinone hydroxylase (CLK1/Coq7/Cat5 family)